MQFLQKQLNESYDVQTNNKRQYAHGQKMSHLPFTMAKTELLYPKNWEAQVLSNGFHIK